MVYSYNNYQEKGIDVMNQHRHQVVLRVYQGIYYLQERIFQFDFFIIAKGKKPGICMTIVLLPIVAGSGDVFYRRKMNLFSFKNQ
jgi:hypothetical protein